MMNKMKYVFLGLAFMGTSMVEAAVAVKDREKAATACYVEIKEDAPANLSLEGAFSSCVSWDPDAAIELEPGTVLKLIVPTSPTREELCLVLSMPCKDLRALYPQQSNWALLQGDGRFTFSPVYTPDTEQNPSFCSLSFRQRSPVLDLRSMAPLSEAQMANALVLKLR